MLQITIHMAVHNIMTRLSLILLRVHDYISEIIFVACMMHLIDMSSGNTDELRKAEYLTIEYIIRN